MCKAPRSRIAKMGSNCETDPAGMKSGIRLAEVVVGETFTIWELCVSFAGPNRRNFLKEFTQVRACDVVKQRDWVFSASTLVIGTAIACVRATIESFAGCQPGKITYCILNGYKSAAGLCIRVQIATNVDHVVCAAWECEL